MTAMGILQQAIVLSCIWYAIARFFYLKHARRIAIELLDDPEYQARTEDAYRRSFGVIFTEQYEKLTKETAEIVSQVEAVSGLVKAVSGFELTADIRKQFIGMLNGWYGNLVKADNRVQQEQDKENGHIAEYIKMNEGNENPQVWDTIKQWAIARNPNLAPLIMIAGQLGERGSGNSPGGNRH